MIDAVKLPNHLAGYLARWRFGEDLRACLPARTYYRVRRDLLVACGVDIASPPPPQPVPGQTAQGATTSGLDPAGWDPDPIEAYRFEPDPELRRAYRQPLLLIT